MYTLFLDSSDVDLMVAFSKDNHIIAKTQYEAWQRQSEYMIPEIDKLMKQNNITRKDIESVVVSVGPGSYTGVRISLTIAKVMAEVLAIPLYAVSSLEALKCLHKTSICLINARSSRSYFAVYDDTNCLVKDCIKTNDEVMTYIAEHRDYVVCGKVDYLDLKNSSFDMAETMLSIKLHSEPVSNALGVNPVYLKDNYDYKKN